MLAPAPSADHRPLAPASRSRGSKPHCVRGTRSRHAEILHGASAPTQRARRPEAANDIPAQGTRVLGIWHSLNGQSQCRKQACRDGAPHASPRLALVVLVFPCPDQPRLASPRPCRLALAASRASLRFALQGMFGFGLGLRESQGGCAGSFKHVFVTSLPPGAELHQKGLHVGTPPRPRCSRCPSPLTRGRVPGVGAARARSCAAHATHAARQCSAALSPGAVATWPRAETLPRGRYAPHAGERHRDRVRGAPGQYPGPHERGPVHPPPLPSFTELAGDVCLSWFGRANV